MNLDKLIEKAEVAKKAGKLGKALSFFCHASRILSKKASVYADEGVGTILEFIDNKYKIDENNKDFTADEWCSVFESDAEMKKFDENRDKLIRGWLIEDKRMSAVYREMGIIYDKTQQSQKARESLEYAMFLTPDNKQTD